MTATSSPKGRQDDNLLITNTDGVRNYHTVTSDSSSTKGLREKLDLINHQQHLPAPSSETGPSKSLYSPENENDRHLESQGDSPRLSWKNAWSNFMTRNTGLALVFLSQLFGSLTSVGTKILETRNSNGHPMNTFQIMFVRFTAALIFSSTYMWWTKVEHFPFGPKEVRLLLCARGFGGFLGAFGIYYSLNYLPLSEATVFTFLSATPTAWVCSILLHEPFARGEQIAGVISFLGVVLITRPTSFFSRKSEPAPISSVLVDRATTFSTSRPTILADVDNVTPSQRLGAIAVALVGVIGAVMAYTSIRWIGMRAHPLLLVNYFTGMTAVISLIVMVLAPNITVRLPYDLYEWGILLFICISGFSLQLLLTAGLQREKSSRATNMFYTQMVFALVFDKLLFKSTPGLWSIIGGSLILGSGLYVSIRKNAPSTAKLNQKNSGDEENDVISETDNDSINKRDRERGASQGTQEVQREP